MSNSPGIPCAQTVQDNLSQGIQTSPVMEASSVQHIQESVWTNRGYGSSVNVSSGTFIPCTERFYPSCQSNPVNRSSGTTCRLGYYRGFDCTGYVVEDPLLDPYVEFEGQGSGGHNGDFVVQGQGPSNYGVRDRNTVERETNKHPVSSNPSGLGGIESRASTGLFDSHVPQSTGFVSNPCQPDTETSPNEKFSHRKQKEPDKYDGEKVEWQDFRVHFKTVATWNG